MTPKQAAQQLGISPRRVRELINDGVLSATEVTHPVFGKTYNITQTAVTTLKLQPRTQGRGRPRKYGV